MSPRTVRLAAWALSAGLVVLLLVRFLSAGPELTVELPDAAGIRAGDEVRIAGIAVGKVTGIAAVGNKVAVDVEMDEGVPVPADTRSEVKLSSLLGQRYLDLKPGTARPLDDGGTLTLKQAVGAYTIERFWLDSVPALTQINLKTLSKAVDVLSTDLAVRPGSAARALAGMSAAAGIVVERDGQIGRLLSATRAVTDEVVAQRGQLTSLLTNADQVMAMIVRRRDSIEALLRETRTLAADLSSLAKTNARPMSDALTQLQTILDVLTQHRDDLGRTLELAVPAMRLYVNSAGDGPWLGVNAPYFILPDSFWCLTRRDIGCR